MISQCYCKEFNGKHHFSEPVSISTCNPQNTLSVFVLGLFLQEKAVTMDTVHRIFFSPEQMKSKQSTKFSVTSIKKENVVSAVTSALTKSPFV